MPKSFNLTTLVAVASAAAVTLGTADAFVRPCPYPIGQCSLRTTSSCSSAAVVDTPTANPGDEVTEPQAPQIGIAQQSSEQATLSTEPAVTPANEPPTRTLPPLLKINPAVTSRQNAIKGRPKKRVNAHKAGVFSPLVTVAGTIIGSDRLVKLRAQIIGRHSELIKSFVATSDSDAGKAVLRQLFNLVDADDSGYLDKRELRVALNVLGFTWLGERQVDDIFARADVNGDSMISLEEFMDETPKLLKVNLIKLAKQNGDDMGLLV